MNELQMCDENGHSLALSTGVTSFSCTQRAQIIEKYWYTINELVNGINIGYVTDFCVKLFEDPRW